MRACARRRLRNPEASLHTVRLFQCFNVIYENNIDPEAVQEHKLTNIEFKNINLKSNYWDVETLFPRFDLMMIYSEL
jgi:hypothetical protein